MNIEFPQKKRPDFPSPPTSNTPIWLAFGLASYFQERVMLRWPGFQEIDCVGILSRTQCWSSSMDNLTKDTLGNTLFNFYCMREFWLDSWRGLTLVVWTEMGQHSRLVALPWAPEISAFWHCLGFQKFDSDNNSMAHYFLWTTYNQLELVQETHTSFI